MMIERDRRKRVTPPLVERGVYWAMATKKGKPMVFAVDSHGDEVRRLVLQDDSWARAEAAIEHLWNHLDVVDPVSQLRLVRPAVVPDPAAKGASQE